jgi:hypothetical protein
VHHPPNCGPTLIAIFDVLVQNHGGRVSRERVRSAFEAAGGAPSRRAFDRALSRLRIEIENATIHTLTDGELLLEQSPR